jgi:predicted ATPase with chaperone activity
VIRVARTIADLEQSAIVAERHVAGALSLRRKRDS